MTIKEIEHLTGMARANIRYYESEGMICPQRRENGYRVYSEEDAAALMKIKLLRSLGISIEDLKALQSGAQTMDTALRQSLDRQKEKQIRAGRAIEITQRMLAEGVDYGMLNADDYLQQLEGESVPEKDAVQPLNLPWRRFFARDLDFMLCSGAASVLCHDFMYEQIMVLIASFALLLLLEPLMLHLFGTTPGKWIFGIAVTDLEEQRLSYGAALERTWTVIWEGEALRIPVILYYFLYKNYRTCENGEKLPWEWDSEVTYKDDALWRCAVYALAYVAVMALMVVLRLKVEGLV